MKYEIRFQIGTNVSAVYEMSTSSPIKDLENQLAQEMGFAADIAKRAALICGEIADPAERLMAAINFIETDMQEQAQVSDGATSRSNKDMKMTVVVRKDIVMSAGKIASQVAHACLQLATNLDSKANAENRKALVREWQEVSSEKIVVLECHSMDAMQSLQSKAVKVGVPTAAIADAGRTEVEPGTITCMAVGPDYEDIIDGITGDLKLYS